MLSRGRRGPAALAVRKKEPGVKPEGGSVRRRGRRRSAEEVQRDGVRPVAGSMRFTGMAALL